MNNILAPRSISASLLAQTKEYRGNINSALTISLVPFLLLFGGVDGVWVWFVPETLWVGNMNKKSERYVVRQKERGARTLLCCAFVFFRCFFLIHFIFCSHVIVMRRDVFLTLTLERINISNPAALFQDSKQNCFFVEGVKSYCRGKGVNCSVVWCVRGFGSVDIGAGVCELVVGCVSRKCRKLFTNGKNCKCPSQKKYKKIVAAAAARNHSLPCCTAWCTAWWYALCVFLFSASLCAFLTGAPQERAGMRDNPSQI